MVAAGNKKESNNEPDHEHGGSAGDDGRDGGRGDGFRGVFHPQGSSGSIEEIERSSLSFSQGDLSLILAGRQHGTFCCLTEDACSAVFPYNKLKRREHIEHEV